MLRVYRRHLLPRHPSAESDMFLQPSPRHIRAQPRLILCVAPAHQIQPHVAVTPNELLQGLDEHVNPFVNRQPPRIEQAQRSCFRTAWGSQRPVHIGLHIQPSPNHTRPSSVYAPANQLLSHRFAHTNHVPQVQHRPLLFVRPQRQGQGAQEAPQEPRGQGAALSLPVKRVLAG